MQTIHKDNRDKLIFAQLNINSIRNKFDFLADIIKDNFVILMISETKEDDSFLDGQFSLDDFGMPFWLDWNRNGGVLFFSLEMTFLQKLLLHMTDLLKEFM